MHGRDVLRRLLPLLQHRHDLLLASEVGHLVRVTVRVRVKVRVGLALTLTLTLTRCQLGHVMQRSVHFDLGRHAPQARMFTEAVAWVLPGWWHPG